jgi:hypothetical protein
MTLEGEIKGWTQLRTPRDDDDDCCDPENHGDEPPTLWFVVGTNTDGDSLIVRPKMEHPCGIKSYWFRVAIFDGDDEPTDSWHTEVEKAFDKPMPMNPTPEFKWGPGEAHGLPVNVLGMTIRVDGLVVSRCATMVRDHVRLIVVAGPV